MDYENPDAVAKVHPATREVLPEDPMDLQGFEVPGDPSLMMRLLVEDYARMGWNTEAIMSLATDPNLSSVSWVATGVWRRRTSSTHCRRDRPLRRDAS